MTMAEETDGWVRDEESVRRIPDRTERYSSAAKYGSGEPALLLDYYEYNRHERLTCPNCSRSGQAEQATLDHHEELFDISCPRCEKMLLVVGYPTLEHIRQAAAAGNAEAGKGHFASYEGRPIRVGRGNIAPIDPSVSTVPLGSVATASSG